MKLKHLILVLLIGCSESKRETSIINNMDVPIITLSGTSYERGFKHGQTLKKEIAEVYSKWKQNIRVGLGKDADSLLKAFMNATNFEPAIRKWTPDIFEEVRGISDGSGQKYNDVFAFQLVDEFWVFVDSINNSAGDHCSCIGVASKKGNRAFTAQNMDLEKYMNGYQVLLHIKGSTDVPEQYIFTCAGLIVTTGMNENGISVNPNTLMELKSSPDGLPVAYFIRGILGKQQREDVLSFINSVKLASGQNYVIGIQDSIYDFETSATRIARFYPDKAEKGIVYHTNHALINHDVKPWYQDYHSAVMAGNTGNLNSETRFRALEKRLAIPADEISQEIIKSALRSKDSELHPICRSYKEGGNVFTFGSVIYTLTGRRSVQVTKGSPDIAGYKEYLFSN
jgi:isopenicillin-N N-acyltransferase like protein